METELGHLTISELAPFSRTDMAMQVKGKWYPIVLLEMCLAWQPAVMAGGFIKVSRNYGYSFDMSEMAAKLSVECKRRKNVFSKIDKLSPSEQRHVDYQIEVAGNNYNIVT